MHSIEQWAQRSSQFVCGMGAAVQAHAHPRCRVCRSGTAALVVQSFCPIWGAMFPEQAALSPAPMQRIL